MPKIDKAVLEVVAQRLSGHAFQETLEAIALGNDSASAFAELLQQEHQTERLDTETRSIHESGVSPLIITGHENLAINYGSCCCPIPGDTIMGVLVPGEGISIHRKKCSQLKEIQANADSQAIEVEWSDAIRQSFSAQLELYALNQKGTLATVATTVAKDNVNISDVSIISRDDNTASVNLTLVISDRNQLSRIVRRLRRERCICTSSV